MRDRWKKAADEKGIPLSRFIVEYVENQLREDESFSSRLEMQNTIDKLQEENVELRRKRNNLDIVIDKLQEELQVYRMQPFLNDQYHGIRQYERKLIDVLKNSKSVRDDAILRHVGIRPSDSEGMKALQRQLLMLERYGVIKKTRDGWSWIH
jgi:hypothetical protein